MKLRRLLATDASLMLEWMHDPEVVVYMREDFPNKTIEDCISFIEKSVEDKQNIHLAVADENDVYQGTVSLKHLQSDRAEFAIVMRKEARGTGIAQKAMQDILNVGLQKLQLKYIYWSVSAQNQRAIRFYDKNGYKRVNGNDLKVELGYTKEEINTLMWYRTE